MACLLLIANYFLAVLSMSLQTSSVLALQDSQGEEGRYNILVSMTDPTSTKSRTGQMAAIARTLVKRGHLVTLLVPSNKGIQGFEDAFTTSLTYNVVFEQSDVDQLKTKMIKTALGLKTVDDKGKYSNALSIINGYTGFFTMSCHSLFGDPTTVKRLEESHFDLMLHIAINPCDFLVAERLGIPYVSMTSSIRFTYFFHEGTLSIPAPSSYVPFSLAQAFTDDMTFAQRTLNFLSWNVMEPLLKFYTILMFRDIKQQYNISPEKSFSEIISGSKLWLTNTDFSLDFARPTSPNWVPIGGVLGKESNRLPQDLEEFVKGAGNHGVIVFSLGSMVTSLFDDELNDVFAKVFSELPQRVLWRFVGQPPRSLGDNTRLMEWLPQNDLLGHSQTRLLLYHGGVNGVYEAIYHKVPMVLLPIFADQPAMGARVAKKGMGVVLDRTKLTHYNIKSAIEEVINNPKYKANVEWYGSIHHDAIASPLDTAVFWIEHVLKFGGDHLRLRGRDLNFIVHNSFDVIAFGLVVAFVVIYVDYLLLRTCYKCLCSKKRVKSKSE